jgi:acetyl esterase/lipase
VTVEMAPVVAPYGSWRSPLPLELAVAGTIRLNEPRRDGDALTWLEGRPSDGGRITLVRLRPGGVPEDVSPPGINVRDRVHEYGGAPYLAVGDLVVVSDFATGRLFVVAADRIATPITPDIAWRYADLVLDASRGRIIAVREDHAVAGREAANALVAIPVDGSAAADPAAVTVLAAGSDFVSSPRISPDGWRLAWLRWNHPNLPWDGTECVVADLDPAGLPGSPRVVAGDASTWTTQPRWLPGGDLVVASEIGEWLGLHRWDGANLVPLTAGIEAEFGYPDWVFGLDGTALTAEGDLLAIGRSGGRDRLWRIDPTGKRAPAAIEMPFTEMEHPSLLGDELILLAASPTMFRSLVRYDLRTGAWETIRRTSDARIDPADVSVGVPVDFPTTDGRLAHAILYRPHNPAFRAPEGELPPLIVRSHGGPTSQATTGLAIAFQLLTSRGIAVIDVDYGGSTGYGRAYRKRLEEAWGIVDVDDCVNAGLEMARRGEADPARLAIEGGSASGFTTLAALAFRDVFRAGVSYFGIGTLDAFIGETHKFESRYFDQLIGPYPATRDRYLERSPALHPEGFSCPVLILQGLDDHVVPPSEAERIVAALRARGIPHAYIAFEGEDHGFRKASSILRSTQAELSFYGAVFGFVPADDLPPLPLEVPG